MKRFILTTTLLTVLLCLLVTPAAIAAKPHTIAHAGGSLEGNNMTNSVEALEHSIQAGYELIELDFAFTSDKKLVLLHDWPHGANYYLGLNTDKPVPYQDFIKCKVFGEYTPLTTAKLNELLKKYPNVKIITDTKEDNIAILTQLSKDCPNMQDRFIPQIFSMSEYQPVKNLGYQNMIMTLYKFAYPWDIQSIANFAIKNDLYAITMDYTVRDGGYAQYLKDRDITVYMHTVNHLGTAVDCISKGAHGVCTDTLLPSEVTYPSWQYYLGTAQNTASQMAFETQTNGLTLHMNSINRYDHVIYSINGTQLAKVPVNQTKTIDLSRVPSGPQTLKATLYNAKGEYRTTKYYYLYKENNSILVFGPQCKYLWDSYDGAKNMDTVAASFSKDIQDIARKSFFVKEGSPLYYQNGGSGIYRSYTAALPAVTISGSVHVPLRDTFTLMGAQVAMNNQNKTMEITIGNKTQSAIITNAENKPANVSATLKADVLLHRNRAMADGALLSESLNRNSIEKNGYLIILPKGVSVTAAQESALLSIANDLYAADPKTN